MSTAGSPDPIEAKVKELVRAAYRAGVEAGRLSCGVGVTSGEGRMSGESIIELLERLDRVVTERDVAREELREIRAAINADPEESTADEVRRVCARVAELGRLLDRHCRFAQLIEDGVPYREAVRITAPHTAPAGKERQAARIESLEAALFRYGQHEPDCRYAELRPDAECTCGLEAVNNG